SFFPYMQTQRHKQNYLRNFTHNISSGYGTFLYFCILTPATATELSQMPQTVSGQEQKVLLIMQGKI
ncbi:MAG: hypothetical protein K2G18_10430, partial [Bacteroidales bacterium]|nr:hypothetical protein [Bacteroidales bacterium]